MIVYLWLASFTLCLTHNFFYPIVNRHWGASTFWLMWIIIPWTCVYRYAFETRLFILDLLRCPEMELLDHTTIIFLIFYDELPYCIPSWLHQFTSQRTLHRLPISPHRQQRLLLFGLLICFLGFVLFVSLNSSCPNGCYKLLFNRITLAALGERGGEKRHLYHFLFVYTLTQLQENIYPSYVKFALTYFILFWFIVFCFKRIRNIIWPTVIAEVKLPSCLWEQPAVVFETQLWSQTASIDSGLLHVQTM